MSRNYRNIFPMSQKDSYVGNDNVDFVLGLENEKLLPGSVTLEGKLKVFFTGTTPVTGKKLYYDHLVGAHGLVRDITVEFQQLGVVENFQYPRYVKHECAASKAPESLGTETDNSVELRVATQEIAQGMMEGMRATDAYQPFSIKLRCSVNKASAPLASEAIGQVRIRLRLAPNNEFLFGEEYSEGNTTYQIEELRLRFQTIPDDGKREKVSMEIINAYKTSIESTNQNISTFVPGLCRAVSMSFISQANENSAGTQNYLQMGVPPGIPPLGASADADTGHYGVEKLYYAINDTETALVGFTLESREELLMNGLRVFNESPKKYSTLIRNFMNPEYPDNYLIGVPFGGLLDFTQNKFACELQSQISPQTPWNAYLYFPTMVETVA